MENVGESALKNIWTKGRRITEDWRKSRNYIICTIKVIRYRRMRWAGYVAHMGNIRNENIIFVGKEP
jgi:hypothetical protein